VSLSLKRMRNADLRHVYKAGAGEIAEERREVAMLPQNAFPSAVRPTAASTESLDKLEVRLGAIEAVLIQLGYGEALGNAQKESHHGYRRASVPPLDRLLDGLPDSGEKPHRPMTSAEEERVAIDQILADLGRGSVEGSGSSDDEGANGARAKSAQEPWTPDETAERLPADEGLSTESMADMLSDTLVANLGVEK